MHRVLFEQTVTKGIIFFFFSYLLSPVAFYSISTISFLPSPLFAQTCGGEILVGDNDPLTGTGDLPPDVWKSLQFTARASGTVSCFKVFLKDLPNPPNHLHNLGYALYTNNPSANGGCGHPGTLIAYGTQANYNWSIVGPDQWHEFPVSHTAQVNQGTLYWVAFASDGGHDGWHFGRASELHDPGHVERKRGCNTHSWSNMPAGNEWNIIYPDESSPCTDNGNYSWYFSSNPNLSDIDSDGIINVEDNCPLMPNGPARGSCTQGAIGVTCLTDIECQQDSTQGFCSINQEDTYSPQGNEIGDACDCEGDFDCDGDIDGSDASLIKLDFGRNPVNNPCEIFNHCNGDFNCDSDVDGLDAALFKSDFGRNAFTFPCPACEAETWCNY